MTGSVVFGDVIQVSGVAGSTSVTITPGMPPPYQVQLLPVKAEALPVARARTQPSRLLLPRHRVVPFTGRDQELGDLAEWARGEAVAVRLVHAGGGQGKTRLAGEFATGCAGSGWAVWRVIHTPTPGGTALTTVASRVALPPSGRALLVVDYADRWPASHLLALLGDLYNLAVQASMVVRVLLLARSAGFWWSTVADRLDSDLGVGADDIPLLPLAAEVDRHGLFSTAARHFTAALDLPDATEWTAPAGLNGPGYAQVLTVHMAALVAVDAYRHGETAPLAPHAVSAYLLRREYTHWQQLHTRTEDPLLTPPQVMRRTTYTATLTGALPRRAARTLLTQLDLAATVPAADQLIDDHRTCYPTADPALALEALHPDRLGEDLIALATPGHPHTGADSTGLVDDWTLTAVSSLFTDTDEQPPAWTTAAVTVLVETARRWPHIAAAVLFPLLRRQPQLALDAGGAALTRLADLPDIEPEVLEAIDALLPPDRHIDLDTAAAAISTSLTRHRLASSTDAAEQALLQAKHARRLFNAGHREQALGPAKVAVAIHRGLAEANPAAYLPDLAGSLSNLGMHLYEVGRRDEAVASTGEAVAIYRGLAEGNPAAYLLDLAGSLSNLGLHLSEVGRRDEAMAPTEEAITIFRGLADADPAAYLRQLAGSLGNLGMHLYEVGRRDEAVAPTEEAVAIYRGLAEGNPAAYLPDLARALSNLGAILSGVGRRDEALPPTEAAVTIYRGLVEANPTAYLSDLAMSLNNLSIRLYEVGRRDEAVAPTEEAVAIYRGLADANPAAYLPDLARALGNLGLHLSGVGRHDKAVAPAEEAVAIYRVLTEGNRAAYLPDLARALGNLGMHLSGVGRQDEAVAPTEEAVVIRRRLAEGNPAAYLPDLATSLNSLGAILAGVGRQDEALSGSKEAVAIYRGLADANPAVYLPNLAASLNNLGLHLSEVNRQDEAQLPTEEAITIFRGLADANPAVNLPEFARALSNRSRYLFGVGRRDEAVASTEDAVTIFRGLTDATLAAYLPEFARALSNLGMHLFEVGRRDEAVSSTEDAVGIYRGLAEANAAAHLPDLAMSLNNLGISLAAVGRRDEALPPTEDAVAIYRGLAEANPAVHLPDLARSLSGFAWVRARVDRDLAKALAAVQEAIDIYMRLAKHLPKAFGGRLVLAYRTLADVLEGLGDAKQAAELRQQFGTAVRHGHDNAGSA